MRCGRMVAAGAAVLAILAAAPATAADGFSAPQAFSNERAGLLFCYALVIAAGSLAGGGLLGSLRLTHTRMQLLMSATGGLMLGIALFQLLPHAVAGAGLQAAVYALAAGLVFMFLLIRAFHFHAHDAAVAPPPEPSHTHDNEHDNRHDHDRHQHFGSHDHDDNESTPPARPCAQTHAHGPAAHELSWIGMAIGLAIHTLIDGMALGAAIQAAPASAGWLAGLGTFAAIALHKPLDALSISSVMAAARRPVALRNLVNLLFAIMCPMGAVIFLLGVRELSASQNLVTGLALGFSAGAFLCIALGDLLPELEFHRHDRVKLTAALLAGLALALAIEQFGHGGGAGHVHVPVDDAAP